MNVIDYVHIYERLNSSRKKKKNTTGSLEKVGFPTASVETNFPELRVFHQSWRSPVSLVFAHWKKSTREKDVVVFTRSSLVEWLGRMECWELVFFRVTIG